MNDIIEMLNFFRKSLSALLLILPAVCPAQTARTYSELEEGETASALRRHVAYLASPGMRGRKAGSEGEKAAADYLREHFAACGLDMLSGEGGELFGIGRGTADTVVSRNVAGVVQGYDSKLKHKYIVVGARMDNLGVNKMILDGRPCEQIYHGANGNASGLSMLIELARMVSTNSILFRRSVIFVGFGASSETFAGAWYFLNRSFSSVPDIEAMINLDMLGSGEDFYAYTSSNNDLNGIIAMLGGQLQPILPKVTAQEPYPSDHRAFYSKGIPSVWLTTGIYPQHNTERDTPEILDYDMMEKELEYIYNLTNALSNAEEAPAFNKENSGASGARTCSFYDCDQRPSFMGHPDPRWFLANWVYQYLKYPRAAVEKGIQGNVQVEFAIDTDGSLTDVRVVRSVDPLLDEEALRVIKASPSWKAGRIKGQKVKAYLTLGVEFKLERKTKRK